MNTICAFYNRAAITNGHKIVDNGCFHPHFHLILTKGIDHSYGGDTGRNAAHHAVRIHGHNAFIAGNIDRACTGTIGVKFIRWIKFGNDLPFLIGRQNGDRIGIGINAISAGRKLYIIVRRAHRNNRGGSNIAAFCSDVAGPAPNRCQAAIGVHMRNRGIFHCHIDIRKRQPDIVLIGKCAHGHDQPLLAIFFKMEIALDKIDGE